MISVFLSKKKTDFATMQMRNGDIILEHCISASVKMERNAIWYLTIEVPESELLGYTITDESVFKVDLNFIKGQLFRMIYPKYNRIKRTYTFYASHIFFDLQYEARWDKEPQWLKLSGEEAAPSSWEEAINGVNNLINDYKIGGLELPYRLNGVSPVDEFTEGPPEDNRLFYIRWTKNPNWGIDIRSRSTTYGTNISLTKSNRTAAQRFYITTIHGPTILDCQVTNFDTTALTFDIIMKIDCPEGIKRVRVPAWSEPNQSNIYWYEAELQDDGTYKVTVDIKEHNGGYKGNYTCHMYLTSDYDLEYSYSLGHIKWDGTDTQLDTEEFTKDQSYKKIIYYYGNSAVELYGVPDGSALSDGNRIAINGIVNASSNQLWRIKEVTETGGWKIVQKRDEDFCWDNNSGATVDNNRVDMRSWQDYLASKENKSWSFTYCDRYQFLKWEGKNLIECIFGSDDNAMCNAYPMVDETHTTAMLDNYNCFFGKMSEYPTFLQPRQIYLTDKEFTEFTETRSMENVLTGIIPKGSGGTIVDNDNTAQGAHYTRITKGPYWDDYEIKRINEITYDDISLNTDNPNSSEAFTSKSAYDAALRNAALMDLKKKKFYKPDVTVAARIIDLFRDSNPTVGNVKLNDELIYISDDGTRRMKFYFDSLTYDVLMDRVTNASLVEDAEVL